MSFLSWHYTHGLSYYLQRYLFALKWINHYFSFFVLITSLFSPWKRLVDTEKKNGFNPVREFEKISFNLISRLIGSIVRLTIIIFGLICLIFVLFGGVLGFALWILIPVLSVSVYFKFMSHPKIVVEKMTDRMQNIHPAKVLSETEAGIFVLDHLEVDRNLLLSRTQHINVSWEKESITTLSHLFKLFLREGLWTEEFLRSQNIKHEDIFAAASWWDKLAMEKSYINDNPNLGKPGIGRELLYGYTPKLNQYSSDLGDEKNFSSHLIGRQNVVSRMERNLSNNQNIILTGKPGVGKHTVVLEFAKKARNGELGEKLAFQRVLELDYATLLSETKDIAKKKTLLSSVLKEASSAGNVILVIRDLHRITDKEIEGIDVTDVLEQEVQSGGLKIISTVSDVEFERFISRNMRLKKYFENINVEQPTHQEAFEILTESATAWERKSGLTITVNSLRLILSGSDKYITEAPYPEKALELLDSAVAFVQSKKGKSVTTEDVKTILAEKTGISFASLNNDRRAQLSNLENVIHERLVNQNIAVTLIAKTLRSKSVGVVDNKRPLGSFLFLGPTGVGKTETAKVLAKVYFGSESEIVRFNMAEYSGREGLERLIGSVDKNTPGALTNGISNKPASLVLLDEIEKAPAEIHNLLLAMLDEGEITDAFDRTIKTSNTFVIATSNAGSEQVRQLINQGISGEELQKLVLENVMQQQLFSPELINRFDGVVVYETLDQDHLYEVAKLMTKELVNNLIEKNIYVYFSDEALRKISTEGYEPSFGARPMRRLIDIEIADMLSKAILDNKITPGAKIEILPGEGKNEYNWQNKTS